MHKKQAGIIDRMLKSLKTKKWNYGKLSLLR
jgi:hypothetical protein